MKRQKSIVGGLFAIPLSDGTYGLGQVVDRDRYSARCALFPKRTKNPDALLEGIDETLRRPLTVLDLTSNELNNGAWPVIGHCVRDYTGFKIPTDGVGVSHTSGAAPGFLAAYHGLEPWDGMFDPLYHTKQLIPGVPVPPTARYKRDMTQEEVATFIAGHTPKGGPTSAVTDGPAELTIQLLYPGTGLPSTDLVRKRQELERRLEAAGAGEVEGAESGAGVMEIFLRTDDVRRAVPLVERTAAELGFADDMLIETAPIEAREEDKDEP